MGRVITYDPSASKFDVPAGTYLTKFIGVVDKKPFENSAYAKPGEAPQPRYGWQFEVIGPPGNASIGKVIEQDTGTFPSGKSKLVELLNMLLAQSGGLQPGQAVDPDQFTGRVYQVQWLPNPRSEKGNPHIAGLMDVAPPPGYAGGAVPAPAAPPQTAQQLAASVPPGAVAVQPMPSATPPAQPAAPRSGPPPRPAGKQAAPAQDKPRKYWVDLGADLEPKLMTHQELQAFIHESHFAAVDVPVCVEGSSQWTTADAYGLESAFPN